ncbi:SprB repeat-containing protein, partial [Candidatus Amoebophilus asiaticus]|nr:SprB repeat-containing protein [Candidatus Amoebophilus asiaticus]
AGSYNVTAKDLNGCLVTAVVTVNDVGSPTTTISSTTNVLCNGGNDGSATVSATGGAPPYTYSWSNGAVTQTASNLTAGTYVATVKDANGCAAFASATITEPAALSLTYTKTDVQCNGNCDGTINITVSGGTTPYTYLWYDGATTEDRTALCVGTYGLTVTDANGCKLGQSTININAPVALSLSISSSNITCNGACDGTASAAATGGTGAYTFSWSNGALGANISSLCPGTYTATVKDANNCQTTGIVTISEPPALTLTTGKTDATCGNADGTASVTASGGTGAYTYSWSNGAATQTIVNLTPATYNVTVLDANGCQSTASVTVNDAGAPTATIYNVINVSCNGGNDGSVSVSGSGGTPPYTYNWSNGTTAPINSNIIAGTYTATITDANSCKGIASVLIAEPSAALSLVYSKTDVDCQGNCNGTINVTISGGTTPYTYLWNDGTTSEDRTSLCVGTYSVTVNDANGCQITGSMTITEPASPLTLSTSSTNVNCNGACDGTASAAATGGTVPYTFTWSNGASGANITSLCPGTYGSTVTDANGCVAFITFTITEPTLLTITTGSTNATCGASDGSAKATASGGTPVGAGNYYFSWSTGLIDTLPNSSLINIAAGSYNVTATDLNGCTVTAVIIVNDAGAPTATIYDVINVSCNGGNDGSASVSGSGGALPYTYNWSNGTTTPVNSNIIAGIYTATITDANNCKGIANVIITEPAALSYTWSSTSPNCSGSCDGIITITLTGGTTPYTYNWNNGQTTATATSLCAGTYTCTYKDANGCLSYPSYTIGDPPPLTVSTTSTNVTCNGACDGTATISGGGGTAPLTFTWSTGGSGTFISSLCPGTYTGTVTDANGCFTTSTMTITEPPALTVSTTSTNVTCNGSCDGSATISGGGGTGVLTYTWSNGGSGA